jgi:hypothetical protein
MACEKHRIEVLLQSRPTSTKIRDGDINCCAPLLVTAGFDKTSNGYLKTQLKCNSDRVLDLYGDFISLLSCFFGLLLFCIFWARCRKRRLHSSHYDGIICSTYLCMLELHFLSASSFGSLDLTTSPFLNHLRPQRQESNSEQWLLFVYQP